MAADPLSFSLLKHQTQFLSSLSTHPEITFAFDIAGYGSGKSFGVVAFLLRLLSLYQGHYLTFGIGGATIKHLKETVIADFLRMLDRAHMPYKHNSQAGQINVGTIEFVYFSLTAPENIFGWNLAGALLDEVDEDPEAARVKVAITAVQERCRVDLPPVRDCPARSPFIYCATTAQGLRGTYLFTEFLKGQKIPYILIRGSTKDNFHLSAKQIENLYKLYTETEARAFLDGEFCNLQVGRVYAEYDGSNNRYQPFEVYPTDRIYVGQDFNPGFNAAVACICRAGRIYVIDEFHWNVVGDAARLLRMQYPDNQITLIPDVSGKELMHAHAQEFDQYHIDRVWSQVNPSISDRILVVNKLFRIGQMSVFGNVQKLHRGLEMRGFDDTGKPQKGHGPDALDHHCDAFEYAVWHITHSVNGFEEVLGLLRHNWGGD